MLNHNRIKQLGINKRVNELVTDIERQSVLTEREKMLLEESMKENKPLMKQLARM